MGKRLPSSFRLRLCALLLIALPGEAALARDFGRFITSAEQRRQLDELRYAQTAQTVIADEAAAPDEDNAASEDEAVVAEDEALPAQVPMTLQGLVYRSGGRSTAWIDEACVYEGAAGAFYVRNDGSGIAAERLHMELPGRDDARAIRPGMSFAADTGRFGESLAANEPTVSDADASADASADARANINADVDASISAGVARPAPDRSATDAPRHEPE